MLKIEERSLYGVFLILVIICCLYYFRSVGPTFPVDDAYIVLHNAQVLKEGVDPNFQAPATLGATSLMQLALVALASYAVPTPLLAQYLVMWLAILVYAVGVIRLARLLQASALQAFLLTVLALTIGGTTHQLLNGLETGLALAGVVWAINLAVERDSKHPWLLPVLCGQLPFIRPELVAVSVLFMARRIYLSWKNDAPKLPQKIFRDAGVCVLSALPWLAWIYLSIGSLHPNTVNAKRQYFADASFPIMVRLSWLFRSFISFFLIIMGVFCLSIPYLLLTDIGMIGLTFLTIFLMAYGNNFPRGLVHNDFRYFYILLPFLIYAVMSGIKHRKKIWSYTAQVILILAICQSLLLFGYHYQAHLWQVSFTQRELAGVSAWCNAHLPPEAKLLIHDAGYISWATKFRMIDFVGLKTPASIPYHASLTEPSQGEKRVEAVHQIARFYTPDYLIMLDEWDRIFRITDGLRQRGWTLTPLRGNESGMRKYYEVYSLSFDRRASASP